MEINDVENKTLIESKFELLLEKCKIYKKPEELEKIKLAFEIAKIAHYNVFRKSGEPYIFHPIEVAHIVIEEIGLDSTSVIAALLHDVVEDSAITLQEIEKDFGKKVAKIIEGLTKISGIKHKTTSFQSENMRKLLLTIVDDIRVILIKLADRLHNMRTLASMDEEEKIRISLETAYIYAPLAHRLGLYNIKSELDDLSLKFTNQSVYELIETKLHETSSYRKKYIESFLKPISNELKLQDIDFEIKWRTKTINSIWEKMKKQNVDFEGVFDLFAIRIIINTESNTEKAECWKAYSIVTNHYQPNPSRLRDWISIPKSNGYESLHTTVMGPQGQWVEIQIRTKRMNEVAEKGLAAHWKYKGGIQSRLDEWLNNVREILENHELNATEFVDNFKLNLYDDEIFIFTPKGDLKKLPAGATVLDFAFSIHSNVGSKCISAKVNHKVVPLRYALKNGDQVEIITAKNQKPNMDWLSFVVTSSAKSKIKKCLLEEKFAEAEKGKELFLRKLKSWKVLQIDDAIQKLINHFKFKTAVDFYYKISTEEIEVAEIKAILLESEKPETKVSELVPSKKTESKTQKKNEQEIEFIISDDKVQNINYTLSKCCNPIFGDKVFGFIKIGKGITIHRINCPNAAQFLAKYDYRIINVSWKKADTSSSYVVSIKIVGVDSVGIVNNISSVVSKDLKVNMQAVSFSSKDGLFDGVITVHIKDLSHLTVLIANIQKVKGVISAERIESTF
ncbi:MAG: bifunctional (p)ppGpp synthetase/guanosine-3',5'-bis(diphosphate) 3'-pyrophosphohydrolase [Bacteroidetes bacterium]|nr:bifunctional (p)ppGpp synthetase/guanosine-3',5'-bis(diphosphate) 3'-pyrophosphohydrolase [Bacteroidota bacterium]